MARLPRLCLPVIPQPSYNAATIIKPALVLTKIMPPLSIGWGRTLASVSPCSGCARGHPSQSSHLALATAIAAPIRPAYMVSAAMFAPYSLRSSLAHAAAKGPLALASLS
jgi:hypothetical protein